MFDFFDNSIQNFFPLGFGEHIIVVFRGGEVAVVDVKSTRSYEIRELDFLRKYSEPKVVNYDKYGKVIEDPRQGIHSLFRRDSFVTASCFQPIELNDEDATDAEEILQKYGYLVISEGQKIVDEGGVEKVIQQNLFFVKLVYDEPDYTLEKESEGLNIIHQINFDTTLANVAIDGFDAFKNIEINFFNKKDEQRISLYVSCIQGAGKKLLMLYEFQDSNLSYAKVKNSSTFSKLMSRSSQKKNSRKSSGNGIDSSKNPCLSMVKLPYQLSVHRVFRTINFKNAI